jgi:hypothetical protein
MSESRIGAPLSMHDPRELGPWTLHSRLGAGGMGVVFYASSAEFQGVALKVIRPGLLDEKGTRDRFRREVAVLRSVHDDHISQFLAADLESEPAWLAVEYVSGPTLREEITEFGPLAEEDWWPLARGMAQALAVLDQHRITHRDLKPGNIIMSPIGPQLIDFGIAHPEDATSLTATGLVTGSPAWLSPEQATLDPIGPPSDVFALGSLLAYAATGRPPFGEGASVAVLMSIATREPDLLGIDPQRSALLHRMLAKDPTRRPTARQVLDRLGDQPTGPGSHEAAATDDATAVMPAADLAAADSNATVVSRPVAGTPLPPPPPRAAGAAAAAAAAGAGAGAVAAEPPTPLSTPAYDPAPPPARPTSASRSRSAARSSAPARRARRRNVLITLLIALALAVGGWLVWQSTDGDAGTPGTATAAGGGGDEGGGGSDAEAPPAPGSDSLVAGPWLLERYAFNNDGAELTISATIRNNGSEAGSADLRTWVYQDQDSLGSVSATVSDVPAGDSVQVEMTGDAQWQAGPKTVVLEAS